MKKSARKGFYTDSMLVKRVSHKLVIYRSTSYNNHSRILHQMIYGGYTTNLISKIQ